MQQQGTNPLGEGRGEKDAHRPALGDSEQGDGVVEAGGVHDGVQVVHAFVERRNPGHRIGKARTAFVELATRFRPSHLGEMQLCNAGRIATL